jgi:SnoaL-like polyketide cyclase
MDPLVSLAHRFVVEFFNRQDVTICPHIMSENYSLRLGDFVINGRDNDYVPALQTQFEQFPGIVMTVHNIVSCGDRIALHVTEHGSSGGPGGRVAAWTAIALYRWDGTQLASCIAQEDYATRRRQLKSGVVDPIDPPCAAPWDTVSIARNESAEAGVEQWLQTSAWLSTPGVRIDDEFRPDVATLMFEVERTEFTELFSAGHEVAFHVRQEGRYLGGFNDVDASAISSAKPYVLYSAGLVSVVDGIVVTGRVIRDRLALRQMLSNA